MHIAIINGPNLNTIGTRETNIYGTDSLDAYLQTLQTKYAHIGISIFQSNIEGELINEIQKQGVNAHAIILNAAGYTHTSIAIADAIKSVSCSVIEVHISNIYAREEYRKQSYIAPVCKGSISGFGIQGYELAIQSLLL